MYVLSDSQKLFAFWRFIWQFVSEGHKTSSFSFQGRRSDIKLANANKKHFVLWCLGIYEMKKRRGCETCANIDCWEKIKAIVFLPKFICFKPVKMMKEGEKRKDCSCRKSA